MNEQRVLIQSAQLFACYGIKTVSMDAIASHLKMSKKTLYEIFSDKENLINRCLEHELKRVVDFSERMSQYAESPLEKLIIQALVAYSYTAGYCPAFYKDLQKYPHACESIEQHSRSLLKRHRNILTDGIRQGYFTDELNANIISRLFRDQMNQVRKFFGEEKMPVAEFL
ncbi:MAG: TetR/AcrR family transcriptional regulator [Rikenellaceae bacterium]|nr:TetR/AcrR family transcriptional regulator [Rikenellaceae bacterium]